MPGPLYGRWVPTSSTVNNQATPKSSPNPESSWSAHQKRDSPQIGRGIEKDEVDQPAGTPPSSKKQKKRKRDSNINERNDPADESTPKKHKSILSKFEKVTKKAQKVRERQAEDEEANDASAKDSEEVLRDLEPLPQPAPVPDAVFEPTFSVLPTWLANPVTVEASKRDSFDKLGVEPHFVKKLEKQGFKDALAVQSTLLPMLHPGYQQYQGDICVSAKTGSGKTLAYLLPIIEALKDHVTPVLSAIVVVPSRQLVDQALQTAEELCAGTKIKVGTALGSTPFTTEQKQLVKITAQYDPDKAQKLHERAAWQMKTGYTERGIIDDLRTMPIDHIPRYHSGVDILICTPGRLVEHIESTTGFLLRSVRWLVIDEADQLLSQNFQGWSTVLMKALHGETAEDLMSAREHLHKQWTNSEWGACFQKRKQLTKVVLSATMETDLTKLGSLRLERPRLVSILEEPAIEVPTGADGDNFELPSTLNEGAVAVRDGGKKPLYLLYLLLEHIFTKGAEGTSTAEAESPTSETPVPRSFAEQNNRVLIFTKSNESASRLSHLLTVLEPSLKDYLRTMTPSSTSKEAKKLLRSFGSGAIKVLIASDAASRGLDIPDITHVVNYDMPTSVTSYVHRVGRTARAGKPGEAWTLFTKSEAAWFWNQVARGDSVRRGDKKVKRIEWKEWNVTYNRKRTYEAALAELQQAVTGADSTE
ncbi:P-loop containing nucleoside triphosphate hydrolase protein [Periconia macrospinosa]|uniref:ATP-dependent RNA helicase n=1 Tax=Periconia macrospinosa TaxID=97972 RepID=A0A2V1DGD9_9PLEO|nr:P-loop containing nucleoside triphosphate hydrolase protein [Periconia macrospinosa]